MLTMFQIRAARAGLGLNAKEAAENSGVSRNTILTLEKGEPDKGPDALASTLRKMQEYYETAGVEFMPDNGLRFIGKTKQGK